MAVIEQISKLYDYKGIQNAITYIGKDENPELVDTNAMGINDAHSYFEFMHKTFGEKGTIRAYHLTQSLDVNDSKKVTADEFLKIGREFVEKTFPDHLYVMAVHTNSKYMHNHFIINSINNFTGKKILDKDGFLRKVKRASNKITMQYGLAGEKAFINNENGFKMSEKVRRIQKRGGNSWILDLKEKADFARHYATNYDHYIKTLENFDIGIRIENKNITYFYPTAKKGIRGKSFGADYDKKGLENKFLKNQEMFSSHPEVLKQMLEINRKASGQGINLKNLNIDISLIKKGGNGEGGNEVIDNRHTKRRESKVTRPSEIALLNSVLPHNELNIARYSNIFSYCKKNKIELTESKSGISFLKGKEFIEINKFTWVNKKNGTKGNLIDFVAAHKNVTFIHAVSIINGNSKLRLLEKEFDKKRVQYKSFNLSKENEKEWKESITSMRSFLKDKGINENMAHSILKSKNAQVGKDETIRFFSKEKQSGAWEYSKDSKGKWNKEKKGYFSAPFFSINSQNGSAFIFTRPEFSLSSLTKDLTSKKGLKHGILSLMEPDEKEIDIYIGKNNKVCNLYLIPQNGLKFSKVEMSFFNSLQKKMKNIGIKLEQGKTQDIEVASRNRDVSI